MSWRKHRLEDCRDAWTLTLPEPYEKVIQGPGFRITHELPCPYCGEWAGHKGSCRLSAMRTGKLIRVVAIEPPETASYP